jgi:hypothetical protein
MSKKLTQTQVLLDHFQKHSTITPMEAHVMFRIRSLSRRINDLEELGYVFKRVLKKDSTGQRYTHYTFEGRLVPRYGPLCLPDRAYA